MREEELAPTALVIGSSGGVVSALERTLISRGFNVVGLSRTADDPARKIDLTDEASIAAAAERLKGRSFTNIWIATGLLHDRDLAPEKAVREIEQKKLMRQFAVNVIGPALVAKHFVQVLPRRGRSIFAALSARVGSIGDNRLGGWYGYRSSKAALNMFIKTMSVELSRTHPGAICVGLHPGTVDTGLSRPFQRNLASNNLFSAEQAAEYLLAVTDQLTPAESGRCFAWDATEIRP